MGIKCSLLGHRFGETAVERDREEEGTEVVITITELETCTRCGETRVVSENKEVTTLADADAGGGTTPGDSADPRSDAESATTGTDTVDSSADPAGPGAAAGAEATGDADPGPDPDVSEGQDAEIIDGAGEESTAQAAARGADPEIPDAEGESDDGRPGAGSGPAGEAGSEEDDAVLIDADESSEGEENASAGGGADDAAERAGETAEVEILGGDGDDGDGDGQNRDVDAGAVESEPTARDRTPGEWGADDDSDDTEPPDTTVETDDAAATWPEESTDSTSQFGDAAGEWPEETRPDGDDDAEAVGPTLERSDPVAVTVPEGMFKCTECGFTTEVESSSLRAGDFCPECHRGTLVQDTDADPDDAN